MCSWSARGGGKMEVNESVMIGVASDEEAAAIV